ncbi:MAG: hypothetical protein DRP45_00755 [Candidatus Zixiibacteriota bacterium]|nr:MAG: hypothetical protein DRP45_00755 [candidate division Zixibacteria bacterium]
MEQMRTMQSLNIKDIVQMVWKRKWLIIVPWILTSVIVVVGVRFLTPTYQSSAIILLDRELRLSNELQVLLGMRTNYRNQHISREALRGYHDEIISRLYLSQVAERLKLDQDPEIQTQVQNLLATSTQGLTADQAILYVLQGRFEKTISVQSAGMDRIQITVESTSPTEARDVANILSELFVTERLRRDIATVRSSQEFSDVQLEKYERMLQNKIAEKTTLETTLRQNQLDASVVSETNRNQIQSGIDQTQRDIVDNQNQERELLSSLSSRYSVSTANLVLRESEQDLRTKATLKTELQSLGRMITKYPWSDPQLLNCRLRQNSLLATIETRNKRLVSEQFSSLDNEARGMLSRLFTVRANLDFFVSKINYLKASLDELRDWINRQPEYQAMLDGLNREIASFTDLRDRFKNQQESSTISQALLKDVSSTKYRVVEPAVLPLAPIHPDKIKISVMGILFGLVIGSAAVILVELLDSSIKKPQELEEVIGLPVIGIVPKATFLARIQKQQS